VAASLSNSDANKSADQRGGRISDAREIVLHTITRLLIQGDRLINQADELTARAEAISEDAVVLARVHGIDWDSDVMANWILARQQPNFLNNPQSDHEDAR
jgi:hypothetical protein